MSLVRDFFGGVLSATGIYAVISFLNKGKSRPDERKRGFATIAYGISLLFCWFEAVSFFGAQPRQNHRFISFEEGLGAQNAGGWDFTHLSFLFAMFVMLLVIFLFRKPNRHVLDLPFYANVIILIPFTVLAYALSYDIAYYWFQNRCSPWQIVCLNIANQADAFATANMYVFLFRSIFLLRPWEQVTVTFFGNTVKEMNRGGIHVLATAPLPHWVCVLLIYFSDQIQLFWDIYVYPDGRENAQQINLRNS